MAAPLAPIDFRSDTVTQPTPSMRRAMAEAVVGDDVYGEDPTVRRLEQESAKLMGKEAALFVPTGTMGNQAAVAVHSRSSGQMILEENAHIALYEGGAASLLWGVTLRTVAGRAGTFGPKDIERHFPPDDPHFSPVRLVSIENTHNYAGGRTWSAKQTAAVADCAKTHKASVHLDGARIFNAAIAQKTTAKRLAAPVDSVMFCLSKGLAAPVGSVLCGSKEFITAAHTVRKTLGGGMRQAGHLAAAGLVALKDEIPRLAEDHANAKALAEGLEQVKGLRVDVGTVETNMVLADVSGLGWSGEKFVQHAQKVGVLCLTLDSGPRVRFVTHRDVARNQVDDAVTRVKKMLG